MLSSYKPSDTEIPINSGNRILRVFEYYVDIQLIEPNLKRFQPMISLSETENNEEVKEE